MAEVRILTTRALIVPDGPRKGKTDRLVFYSVDGGPARFVRVAEEAFSEAAAKDAIARAERENTAIHGKTFTL